LLEDVRRSEEREPPPNLPRLGKGQQDTPLAAVGYDNAGRPRALSGPDAMMPNNGPPARVLRDIRELATAMAAASPGQVLELAAGTYTLDQTLVTGRGGSAQRPIVVRAAKPGTVEIVVTAVRGIVVSEPYWVFENLDWRGDCARHE